jgi:uncharacterized membrane protein
MSTYEIIQKAHSGWAYLVLIFLVIAIVSAFIGLVSRSEFTSGNRKLGLFALVSTHIQLVIGLVLYFISPYGKAVLGQMKNPALRLTSLEHPLINIIAIILITVGWSRHKKRTTSKGKFKSFAIFYSIGLALILSRLPWNMWLN